jgi:hypothetical protein
MAATDIRVGSVIATGMPESPTDRQTDARWLSAMEALLQSGFGAKNEMAE